MALTDLPEKIQRAIQLKATGASIKELSSATGYGKSRLIDLVGPTGIYASEVEAYKEYLAKKNVKADAELLKERRHKAEELMNGLYELAKSAGDPIARIKATEQYLDRCPDYAKTTKQESKVDQTVNQAKEIVWRLPKDVN